MLSWCVGIIFMTGCILMWYYSLVASLLTSHLVFNVCANLWTYCYIIFKKKLKYSFSNNHKHITKNCHEETLYFCAPCWTNKLGLWTDI